MDPVKEAFKRELEKIQFPKGFKGNVTLNCDEGRVKKYRIEIVDEITTKRSERIRGAA